MQLNIGDVFRLEVHALKGALHLLGIENEYSLEFVSILESDIDSLIAHARLGKFAEVVDPTLRKMESHNYLSGIVSLLITVPGDVSRSKRTSTPPPD